MKLKYLILPLPSAWAIECVVSDSFPVTCGKIDEWEIDGQMNREHRYYACYIPSDFQVTTQECENETDVCFLSSPYIGDTVEGYKSLFVRDGVSVTGNQAGCMSAEKAAEVLGSGVELSHYCESASYDMHNQRADGLYTCACNTAACNRLISIHPEVYNRLDDLAIEDGWEQPSVEQLLGLPEAEVTYDIGGEEDYDQSQNQDPNDGEDYETYEDDDYESTTEAYADTYPEDNDDYDHNTPFYDEEELERQQLEREQEAERERMRIYQEEENQRLEQERIQREREEAERQAAYEDQLRREEEEARIRQEQEDEEEDRLAEQDRLEEARRAEEKLLKQHEDESETGEEDDSEPEVSSSSDNLTDDCSPRKDNLVLMLGCLAGLELIFILMIYIQKCIPGLGSVAPVKVNQESK